MAITTSVDGDNRTVTIEYTALKTKVDPTLTDAAQWIYEHPGKGHGDFTVYNEGEEPTAKTFDELTNLEKLQLIDKGVKASILHWAKNKDSNDKEIAAREAVEASNPDYSLNGE